MSTAVLKEKTIKDLTIKEFKHLMQEVIAEDIEAWQETFEIMADKTLMKQIRNAEEARTHTHTHEENLSLFHGKK